MIRFLFFHIHGCVEPFSVLFSKANPMGNPIESQESNWVESKHGSCLTEPRIGPGSANISENKKMRPGCFFSTNQIWQETQHGCVFFLVKSSNTCDMPSSKKNQGMLAGLIIVIVEKQLFPSSRASLVRRETLEVWEPLLVHVMPNNVNKLIVENV